MLYKVTMRIYTFFLLTKIFIVLSFTMLQPTMHSIQLNSKLFL
jgi:hypothetical protein